jgi:DNA-binding HxlR family transcriptional regulator
MISSCELRHGNEHVQDAHEATLALSHKWVLAVLVQLEPGPQCHNELARATGLSENKPLDRALHRLVSMRLVDRTVRNVGGSAPRVQYRLTTRGQAILPVIDELAAWWQAGLSTV